MSDLKKSASSLRKEATKLKKRTGISQHEALDVIAKKYQQPNWKAVLKAEAESLAKTRPAKKQSRNFMDDDDVAATDSDHQLERNEDLPSDLKFNIAKNQAYFVSKGLEFSMFEPTITGLNKSILDATIPVRTHFDAADFHCFSQQKQGPEHKVVKRAFFVTPESTTETTVRLYRPITKHGDPRMWFPKLGGFANATEQIAIVILNDSLYLFNFSRINFAQISNDDHIGSFINEYQRSQSSIAEELLAKLRDLSKSPIPSTVDADTAIGRAIETALGIEINSSKQPDYKGIEIKSGRAKRKNRSNLFAQVADWTISPLSSSEAILDKYGYQRGEDFKLYCTTSALKPNSQGLQFFYNVHNDLLIEKHKDGEAVAIWPGKLLRDRLLEKHAETFWISAKSVFINSVEHFQLTSVIHTKKPIQTQLLPLIESGVITMDHLIKRKVTSAGKTQVSEKGPLFKINKRDLNLLFPAPITYKLID
ncbi:MvaI/BcnI family restriction endonuclease [Leeia sp. TBRC 13508]|uniref:MvaI/BcnI family restriction endonuclease n=1 Tax=Leeia speluncae TaxID=2884804 RepID=A0ABS8D4W9_9NEIS|nr:MvaI/BcnI family restriction endonuclease [Leeia speluncae]MCB6183011.1 MvaI/BcnI family restriction endonuclease [Leeia speluncae]